MKGSDEPLRLLILGAHPDDAEYSSGGLASLYRQAGHVVKMVSLTDGSAGHHAIEARQLAEIRRAEAEASAATIGAAYEVWDYLDGNLQPTLSVRDRVIQEIRAFRPDLLLTHRTNDYHPDHRAAGQAVQDAAFLVRVPRVVPQVPPLQRDPVVAYLPDLFTRPCPMEPHVALDIGPQLDAVVGMLACHRSQVFQWLPWLEGKLAEVPEEETARRAWLRTWYCRQIRARAECCRSALAARYGQQRSNQIEYVEFFEICQYGSPLDDDARRRLFGFLPG